MSKALPETPVSVDNLLIIVEKYRRAFSKQIVALLKDDKEPFLTRNTTTQKNASLYGEIGAAYTTYRVLRSYIRREDGKNRQAFDNLDSYFNNGLLVVPFTGNWLSKKLGKDATSCLRHVRILEAAGFLCTFRFKGPLQTRAKKHLALLGWHTLEYSKGEQVYREIFFEDLVLNVTERIEAIKKLKATNYTCKFAGI